MATDEHSGAAGPTRDNAIAAIEAAISRHLQALSDIQTSLLSTLRCKRKAFEASEFDSVRRFAAEEERLMSECSRLERERHAILLATENAGVRAASLSGLAAKLSLSKNVQASLAAARHDAEEIQRESWTQLIVASRAAEHYQQLIKIIASAKDSTPSFGSSEGYDCGGGTLIDAAA